MLPFGRLSLKIVCPEAKLHEVPPRLATVIVHVHEFIVAWPFTLSLLVAVKSGALGVAVGAGVEVDDAVAVGVAAAAMTTPRVLPPSCVKL